MRAPYQKKSYGDEAGAEPPRLPEGRFHLEPDRGLRAVPLVLAVAGDHAKTIRACAKVGVNSLPGRNRLTPAAVEIFEKISKANLLGNGEAQPRVSESDSFGRGRDVNRVLEVYATAISRKPLNLRDRGRRGVRGARRVDNRQSATQRKPDPPRGVGNNRPASFDSLRAAQTIGCPILAKIGGSQRARGDFVPFGPQDVIGGRDPKPSQLVFCHTKDFSAQQRG